FFLQMSEETDNVVAAKVIDEHLQKDLRAEENRNIVNMLRGKVREKFKNAKINQGEKSSTQHIDKVCQCSKVNNFFSLLLKTALWNSTYILQFTHFDYSKHFSLGANLQNVAESQDEDFMEKVIFTDLLEVKAAEYEDDQEQIKKQQANIFVPSSSPGNVLLQ
uniref:DUF5523 domain-containing protein n=1 Tax=Propithecus coquereli TaxID=379532 RepID=A0A2K6EET7_PROCO